MNAIFISYRRGDSAYAGRLYADLSARFGERQVFMDVDDIVPGRPFPREVMDALLACRVMIVVIGEKWRVPETVTRLRDPNDWVHQEIKTALTREAPVIPLLVGGTTIPSQDDLPRELGALALREAFELRDGSWADDERRLCGALHLNFGVRRAWSPGARRAASAAGVLATAALVWAGVHFIDFDPIGKPAAPVVLANTLGTIPLSLLNSMRGNEDLYWFRFSGNNPTDDKAFVKVRFSVKGPVTIVGGGDGEEELIFDLPPGGGWTTKDVPVNLKVLNFDTNGSMSVSWSINTLDERPLAANATTVDLLPANTVKWDLKRRRFDNERTIETDFPTDFLIASLAAWTVTKNDSVRARAAGVFGPPGAAAPGVRDWFARLYAASFGAVAGAIRIAPPDAAFPRGGEQPIHTALQVIRDRIGTHEPLEVVLYLAALTKSAPLSANPRTSMVVLPPRPGSDESAYVLTWREADGVHGIEIGSAATRDTFADNERATTARLRSLQASMPRIFEALDAKGVFYEAGESVVAIDFDRALVGYKIRALPYDG